MLELLGRPGTVIKGPNCLGKRLVIVPGSHHNSTISFVGVALKIKLIVDPPAVRPPNVEAGQAAVKKLSCDGP